MYLPLFLKTEGLACLVVGGGRVATHKIGLLLAAGCDVTVVSPEIEALLKGALELGRIRWIEREYAGGDCAGFRLVIAATPLADVNRAVHEEACRRSIPVNVVDVPELCTVIFGATWRDGPLTISVSTGGIAPFMAAAVRDQVSLAMDGMGRRVSAAGRFRQAARASIPDAEQRKRLLSLFARRICSGAPPDDLDAMGFDDWIQWLNAGKRPA